MATIKGAGKFRGIKSGLAQFINVKKAFDDAVRQQQWEKEQLGIKHTQAKELTAMGEAGATERTKMMQRGEMERLMVGSYGAEPNVLPTGAEKEYAGQNVMLYGGDTGKFKGYAGPQAELETLPGYRVSYGGEGGGKVGTADRTEFRNIIKQAESVANAITNREAKGLDQSEQRKVYTGAFMSKLDELTKTNPQIRQMVEQTYGSLDQETQNKVVDDAIGGKSVFPFFWRKMKEALKRTSLGPIPTVSSIVLSIGELIDRIKKGDKSAVDEVRSMAEQGVISVDEDGGIWLNEE